MTYEVIWGWASDIPELIPVPSISVISHDLKKLKSNDCAQGI
jgi:hypothetical protein